jgi:7,8-dihydroneopterin aldolase/epimerase/oxygenase
VNKIIIKDLEVFYRVGVPDEEREEPQRLLITVEMEHDFSEAARTDNLAKTIDYFAVAQRLLKFGEGRSWKLIEKLANDIATFIVNAFQASTVTIEVKKFIIPEARFVAVKLRRGKSDF